jgi:hypothetical protein
MLEEKQVGTHQSAEGEAGTVGILQSEEAGRNSNEFFMKSI